MGAASAAVSKVDVNFEFEQNALFPPVPFDWAFMVGQTQDPSVIPVVVCSEGEDLDGGAFCRITLRAYQHANFGYYPYHTVIDTFGAQVYLKVGDREVSGALGGQAKSLLANQNMWGTGARFYFNSEEIFGDSSDIACATATVHARMDPTKVDKAEHTFTLANVAQRPDYAQLTIRTPRPNPADIRQMPAVPVIFTTPADLAECQYRNAGLTPAMNPLAEEGDEDHVPYHEAYVVAALRAAGYNDSADSLEQACDAGNGRFTVTPKGHTGCFTMAGPLRDACMAAYSRLPDETFFGCTDYLAIETPINIYEETMRKQGYESCDEFRKFLEQNGHDNTPHNQDQVNDCIIEIANESAAPAFVIVGEAKADLREHIGCEEHESEEQCLARVVDDTANQGGLLVEAIYNIAYDTIGCSDYPTIDNCANGEADRIVQQVTDALADNGGDFDGDGDFDEHDVLYAAGEATADAEELAAHVEQTLVMAINGLADKDGDGDVDIDDAIIMVEEGDRTLAATVCFEGQAETTEACAAFFQGYATGVVMGVVDEGVDTLQVLVDEVMGLVPVVTGIADQAITLVEQTGDANGDGEINEKDADYVAATTLCSEYGFETTEECGAFWAGLLLAAAGETGEFVMNTLDFVVAQGDFNEDGETDHGDVLYLVATNGGDRDGDGDVDSQDGETAAAEASDAAADAYEGALGMVAEQLNQLDQDGDGDFDAYDVQFLIGPEGDPETYRPMFGEHPGPTKQEELTFYIGNGIIDMLVALMEVQVEEGASELGPAAVALANMYENVLAALIVRTGFVNETLFSIADLIRDDVVPLLDVVDEEVEEVVNQVPAPPAP